MPVVLRLPDPMLARSGEIPRSTGWRRAAAHIAAVTLRGFPAPRAA
jgi:hypothetical protein